MKKTIAALAFAIIVTSVPASASQLDLFGTPLTGATSDQLITLAQAAGAHLASNGDGVATFDATNMQLPGLRSLTIVFYQGKFALARYMSAPVGQSSYDFAARPASGDEERLRKILQGKYGAPAKADVFMGVPRGKFDDQYIDDGTYEWRFDHGLRLSFKKEFADAISLTYFDPATVGRLKQAAAAADAASVKAKTDSLGGKL